MSKITFRAGDDLVERVEALETSKSEVMRDALRSHLDAREPAGPGSSSSDAGTGERGLDELVAERVDALVESRLDEAAGAQDVNVTVQLAGDGEVSDASQDRTRGGEQARSAEPPVNASSEGATPGSGESARQCPQCGAGVRDDHVYCPNCGEKATRRIFCECGDELRSDWAYCPGCGRRTPSADVLEQ
jgi:predicted transcriptional regulator